MARYIAHAVWRVYTSLQDLRRAMEGATIAVEGAKSTPGEGRACDGAVGRHYALCDVTRVILDARGGEKEGFGGVASGGVSLQGGESARAR